MNSLTLRRAERKDAEALIGLITALAEFEHLSPPDQEAQARLIEHGFGERPKFEAWLADWEGAPGPIGYAFLFETYSTFLARPTLYLEDLFVLPEFQRRGVGKALLRHCVALAHERGCGRMEWTCLDWNTKAQAVYEKLGAKHLREWYLYRLTRDEMSAVIDSDSGETMDTGAPQNNIGKIIAVILAIAFVLLALLVWGGVSLFRATSSMTAAAEAPAGQFLDALQAHHYQAAYKMLTPQLQANTSVQSFQDIQELLEKRRGAMTGHSNPSNWFVNSNNGVTTVQLTYTEQFQHGRASVTLTMMNTPSGWRVYRYRYQL